MVICVLKISGGALVNLEGWLIFLSIFILKKSEQKFLKKKR